MEVLAAYMLVENFLYIFQRKLQWDYLTVLFLRIGVLIPLLHVPLSFVFGFDYFFNYYWILAPIPQILFWLFLFYVYIIYSKYFVIARFLLAPIFGQSVSWIMIFVCGEYLPLLAPFERANYASGILNNGYIPFLVLFVAWLVIKSVKNYKRQIRYLSIAVFFLVIGSFAYFFSTTKENMEEKYENGEIVFHSNKLFFPWEYKTFVTLPNDKLMVTNGPFRIEPIEISQSGNDFSNSLIFYFNYEILTKFLDLNLFPAIVRGYKKENGFEITIENVFYDERLLTVRMIQVILDQNGTPEKYKCIFSFLGKDIQI